MLSQLEEEEGVLETGWLGFLWDEFSSFLDGGLASFFAGLVVRAHGRCHQGRGVLGVAKGMTT